MNRESNLSEVRKSLESLPGIVMLETLYSKNNNSPVAIDKSTIQKYAELVEKTKFILFSTIEKEHIETVRDFPFTSVFTVTEMIMLTLEKTPEILLEVMRPEYTGEYLAGHSLNVAFLCCKIGMRLDFTFNEVLELGAAALLHDIGMTRINKNNYLHERDLSDSERHSIEDHPLLGWQFFKELQDDFPWLLRVILEEHKREHSQGYPDGIVGEIHQYSKIVGLADSFEALSHSRIFRKAFHPTDALKVTIEGNKIYFDKKILKTMIDVLSMYPVGSVVQLNNKKVALVIQSVEGMPMRPIIRMLESASGAFAPTKEVIDLSKDHMRYITGLVYPDNYQVSEKTASART
jgi:HD-GYP domain-containing protein (c-di-GMP phosphodiesterase class II)